jgi:hypothetical protein
MSALYRDNKTLYPVSIKDVREEIITLLIEGFSEQEAFDQAV